MSVKSIAALLSDVFTSIVTKHTHTNTRTHSNSRSSNKSELLKSTATSSHPLIRDLLY